MTANAAERLLQQYVDNFRRLPWRSPPGAPAPDPYRVWLSEVMLQQTTVATVAPRFERFVDRWPTIEALAGAPDEDVLSEWAGLGYYARARNLIACAREVVRRGGFPNTEAELRMLPGIGAYTAAAIAAIAFGEDAAAVDTNVRRVIARLCGIERPGPGEVERQLSAMLPRGRVGDFTQALMDLGATTCRSKKPACGRCPMQGDCAAYRNGHPEFFPAGRVKRERPTRHGIAYWIEQSGHVWLVRRPARGLLGGMAALPGTEWTEAGPEAEAAALGTVRHVFTHFALQLTIVRAAQPIAEGWWEALGDLDKAGLPTLYRKAAHCALTANEDRRPAA